MELQEYSYRFEDLDISTEIIEKFLGYTPGHSPEPVPQMIREVMEKAQDLCEIKGGYVIVDDIDIDDDKKTLKIGDIQFNIRKIISHQIKKAEKLALFVCTAGNEIGAYSRQLMRESDMLKGYVADVVGSEAVEAAMDLIQDDLEKQMSLQQLNITNRYSPGYCDWNVNEQHKLFSFFPDKFCGITLTPSSLMVPVKSISGILGIGKDVKKNDYACNFCSMVNCIYREKRVS